jgi:hypothetical protein
MGSSGRDGLTTKPQYLSTYTEGNSTILIALPHGAMRGESPRQLGRKSQACVHVWFSAVPLGSRAGRDRILTDPLGPPAGTDGGTRDGHGLEACFHTGSVWERVLRGPVWGPVCFTPCVEHIVQAYFLEGAVESARKLSKFC